MTIEKDLQLLEAKYDAKIAALQAVIEANDRLNQQRYDNDHVALRRAFESNELRLNGMNEFRAALTDQNSRLLNKTEYDVAHAALTEKIDAGLRTLDTRIDTGLSAVDARNEVKLGPIIEKLDQFGKPNWTLITSFLSIAAIMVTGFWLVIGLKIENSSQPLNLAIEQIKTTTAAADRQVTESKAARDRQMAEQLERINDLARSTEANGQAVSNLDAIQSARTRLADNIVSEVAGIQTDIKTDSATTRVQLSEIETQLKMMSTVMNIEKDDSNQLIGVLWQKAFNKALPTKSFRPDLYK